MQVGCLILITTYVVAKIVVMSAGYIIIFFIRDPLRLFIEDVVIENSAKEDHNTILMLLTFSFKSVSAVMSLCFMLMLLKLPLFVEIVALFFTAFIGVILCLKLYKMISLKKRLV